MILLIRLTFVVTLVGLIAAPTARAEDEDAAKARSLYEKGMGHFQLQEYDAAIDKWQAGFRLKPVPEFLFNIAQAYRLSKRPDKAVQFYKTYVRLAPAAANRAEVENHIAALNKIIEQQPHAATSSPPGAPAHVPATEVTTEVPSSTQAPPPKNGSPPSPASTARADLTASAPRDRSITKKKWFWPLVGSGAALVVAAVVVGVIVGTHNSDSARPLPALRF